MRPFVVALALLALPLAGCMEGAESPDRANDGASDGASDGAPTGPTPPAVDEGSATGPAWRFADTAGATHTRDSAAGKPAVLFFMATWCSSCRAKAAWLDDVHARYGERVGFYSVGQDPTESSADLDRWRADYGHDWPHGLDADRNVQRAFAIRQQSSFVVLDDAGEVVEKWQYPGASQKDLTDAIDAALARA